MLLKSKKDKLQFILGDDGSSWINMGLNTGKYAYGISEYVSGQFQSLSMQGPGINPPIKEWLRITIKHFGSILELYVNNVRVCKAQANIHNSQVEVVYKGMQEAQLKDISFNLSNPKAFVVMHFPMHLIPYIKRLFLQFVQSLGMM